MKVKLFESQAKAKEVLNDNEPRLVRAEGKEICIVRKGERIFAFQDACAHMGENLHKGKTNYLNEIVCPLHTYRFNMKTGEEAEQRCKSLKVYDIITDSEGIHLEI
ncbi:3-phenylpropionate/trans-cinnamate dioxygenase ferredoxin subunit [Ekhidna lutea]|uniref:3-phenylpropionate/trans-cinnamate dioxygenase ferredoxin subunit n=1 Tax=Ekhidna lutea TaxID=447679 RepID=A0A239EPP4_EKHLU|nr:Rieske (2Fe-2S) protein [Ekhidna lutea]SNS45834.1 3-phenylpropionate/trans-cinnamate dioxygenase ferredoxin subunit [Ekhidna lutea]